MVDQPKDKNKTRTSVELFAGGGGLAMAAHQAGLRPLLFNEFNARACETLEASKHRTLSAEGLVRLPVKDPGATAPVKPARPEPGQPTPLYPGDVRDLDMSGLAGKTLADAVDILAGGPPCQPFSAGGVAKGDEDKRNMFPAMFKAVREIRPKAVICENVRGLLRPSFKDYFQYIQDELKFPFEERDDDVPWQKHAAALAKVLKANPQEHDVNPKHYRMRMIPVNAANYGVPQIRNRVILVAFRADLEVDMDAFEKSILRERFSEAALHESMREEDGPYWQRHPDVPGHVKALVRARLPKKAKDIDPDVKPWRTLRDAIAGYGTTFEESERLPALPDVDLRLLDRRTEQAAALRITDHIGWPDARIYKGHTPNELDRPAKTVKAGVHGVPGGESVVLTDEPVKGATARGGSGYVHRYMTVRETARVMTFPDEWLGSGPRGEKMRQLGNAVPVTLGKFFMEAVAETLTQLGY